MSWTRTETIPPAVNPRSNAVAKDSTVGTVLTAYAGIFSSILAIPLVLIVPGHWPALAGAFLLACVPPGAAVMCWVDSGIGAVQAGLTLVLSLTVTAITSAVMIWLSAWHPKVLFASAAVSVLSCVVRLGRGGTSGVTRTLQITQMIRQGLWVQLAFLFFGLGLWAYGVSQIRAKTIGSYGLLASANVWFFLGLAALLAGGLLELTRPKPRAWLLGTYLVALIVAIYGIVPILFNVPEYAWVYKHIGIAQAFGRYGRITDPSNIYQQWPALFTTVAAVSGLAKVGPLNFAAWAPLAFELADALLLLGIFRMLAVTRRAAYLALFLYEGLIAWVGQDYLSPQAFGYLLWLGIAMIIVRWLLVPGGDEHGGIISRLRARLLTRMPAPPAASPAQRRVAVTLIVVIYFAIVAAHQLTPYMLLLGVGALVLLGVLWRGWQFLAVLIIVSGGYLAPRYGLISSQFGGLFSGGNMVENASGIRVANNYGAHEFTGKIIDVLAASMYLPALGAIVRRWRALGLVAVPALLAFSPFVIPIVQKYGGEAIYRVYMFSSPWCAILIADFVMEMRATVWRRLLVICACAATLLGGLQGLYGPVALDAFTPQELSASLWLYNHAPRGSLLVMAVDNFPVLEVANYNSYGLQVIPADPQMGVAWLNEANVPAVEKWLASFGNKNVYVVFSRNMDKYVTYLGFPYGYFQMKSIVGHTPGWSVAYRNADTTIYRVEINKHSTRLPVSSSTPNVAATRTCWDTNHGS